MTIDPRLINIAIAEVPSLIDVLKAAFVKAHPDAPVPTNEDVIAAYREAMASSLTRDAELLAELPPDV